MIERGGGLRARAPAEVAEAGSPGAATILREMRLAACLEVVQGQVLRCQPVGAHPPKQKTSRKQCMSGPLITQR